MKKLLYVLLVVSFVAGLMALNYRTAVVRHETDDGGHREGQYDIYGRQDGYWVRYYSDGTLFSESEWDGGQCVWIRQYTPEGEVDYEKVENANYRLVEVEPSRQ